MKILVKVIVGIILAASLLLNGYFINQYSRVNTVTEVYDGDTFTLGDGQRVRLIGVNAPEIGRCLADEAKIRLSDLVLHKIVRVTEDKRDTYGRKMGLVYVGNLLVNEIMLKEGLARPDYTSNSQSEKLKAAFHYASDNKLGIHSKCEIVNPTPPSPDCVIKGNIEASSGIKYYHLPTCRHYKQIVLNEDQGERFFCSEQEASAAGFHLAPDCLR
jgi:micrococcal nuclease